MPKQDDIQVLNNASDNEVNSRSDFFELFRNAPIPDDELLQNLGLFINRQALSRILFMADLYKKILPVNGIVVELGTRWGQNLALFQSLRGIFEPFNHTRKLVGFDTFSGFASLSDKDGEHDIVKPGAYGVSSDYEGYLDRVLSYHQSESPIAHIRKFELVAGDATETLPRYLEEHPETIIALAYFDFDIYEPTKQCLEALKPYLHRGSIIAFDELNCPQFPGETVAVREALGFENVNFVRDPHNPWPSYVSCEHLGS